MPNAWFPTVRASYGLFIWTFAGISLLQVLFVSGTADVGGSPLNSPKAEDNNLQIEDEISKRDWNKNLKMWGKRGWSNLRGGWALKRDAPSWDEEINYSPPIAEKRAWQRLQGGWGKRYAPSNDEITLEQLASLIDQTKDPQNSLQYGPDDEFQIDQYQKRNWNKFSDGWGKRDKWEKFRGSWGKREPAWSNLKGIWGKRSTSD